MRPPLRLPQPGSMAVVVAAPSDEDYLFRLAYDAAADAAGEAERRFRCGGGAQSGGNHPLPSR